jgi:hypothetical protein
MPPFVPFVFLFAPFVFPFAPFVFLFAPFVFLFAPFVFQTSSLVQRVWCPAFGLAFGCGLPTAA